MVDGEHCWSEGLSWATPGHFEHHRYCSHCDSLRVDTVTHGEASTMIETRLERVERMRADIAAANRPPAPEDFWWAP